ncbi:MAG TPA: DUF885 family protein, partial [Thermoanaerobaculia bacterium]
MKFSSIVRRKAYLLGVILLATSGVGGSRPAPTAGKGVAYEDLVSLFAQWRAFQRPKIVEGVPDYRAMAMAAQQRELASYRQRLAAIDPSGWSIPQQVDYHIVRAEMNGLDFDHRVRKPWANNPAFYVTVFSEESDQPAREGPFAEGAVELWSFSFPLTMEDAGKIAAGLHAIPGLLAQAKTNLTGDGRDLWIFGAQSIRQQSAELRELGSKLGGASAGLKADVERARQATDDFAAWLDSRAPSKRGQSGVGIENYNWYLKNVQLVPYTWQEEVALMERELARSQALLAMEELRNVRLPPQLPITSAAEYAEGMNAGVTQYMAFLREHEILTIRDWMDGALRARIGQFTPGPLEFFSEVDYRDPEIMRTHGYHWFDKGWMAHDPHPNPIRRGALLYNIFNTRTEGHATGWEELMMQAGMFDARPRSRELVYILVAERAARALGELKMQSNELTLEEASSFACSHTPRGWLSMKGQLVRSEQHLYLQQPGYGTSYLIGKIEIEKLLDERRQQLGDRFTMKRFMDEFNAAGLIPAP